ncbi:phage major capsid protein [Parabacteroides goldsteinii]|jgi:HK97 family phage major capsid protein|uniref:phage major capsid protein n=1 Tax=Parabacteroides goldsteinii TaxID=328812 RepID=UPI0020532305|nr:phage major capsid protein [Parabacteroides goldsteinii]DAT74214.1 MAG TPA: major capsid protein [Caudoviricetes sp.]
MAKEVTLVELKDKLGLLNEERKDIFAGLAKESRRANEGEEKRLGEIASEVAEVEFEIKLAEARNKQRPITPQTKRSSGNLLAKAIRSMLTGESSDEVEALLDAGKRSMTDAGLTSTRGNLIIPMEFRGDFISAKVAGDGTELITEDLLGILQPIRDNLVMVKAGSTFLTGLKGNIGIPSYSGSSVDWASETETAKNGKGTFKKIELSPKRLTAYLDISKQFLAQDSLSTDAMMTSDLARAIAIKLQRTILSKDAHDEKRPDGFFTGTPEYKINGVATFANLVAMESAVPIDEALVNNLAYLTSVKGSGILKSTLRAPNVAEGFIMEKGQANGYNVYATSGMASGLQDAGDEEGIIFGNWADYVIGQWGALDITVDPYTKAADGEVRLVINAFFDAKARRPESFVVGSIK